MQLINLIPVLTVILLVFILKKLRDYGFIKVMNVILIEVIEFIMDWRTFISFMIVWMFTNGWAYAFMIIGPRLDIGWMSIVGTAYMAFLWAPFTPEKVVVIPMTVYVKKKLFPKHKSNTINTIEKPWVLDTIYTTLNI